MGRHKILVVDDDKFVCQDIVTSLDSTRFDFDMAHNKEDAFAIFDAKRHHIIVTDLGMPNENDGFVLIDNIKSIAPSAVIIVLTGCTELKNAVRAMKAGAVDYVTKPFETDQLIKRIENITNTIDLRDENIRLRSVIASQYEMAGNSSAMKELKNQIAAIARSDSYVLITGPNGTGKELVAWSIQNQSSRADKPFIVVNCAAIPDNLIESELFGTSRGAFTGSIDKKGKFEQAHEGTIFLDEIGDMSLTAQAKVLRVLESGDVQRIGSDRSIHVNVRVIAATNKNLPEKIRTCDFREDLFYRLNVATLQTLPLKYRTEDIPSLIEHKLRKANSIATIDNFLTNEALSYLSKLEWPGNIRELYNAIERMLIYWSGTPINPDAVKRYLCTTNGTTSLVGDTSKKLKDATADFEREYILKVIAECNGSITDAAERLDLQRPYLYEKIKKLGIER
jgi:two-component system nitrogen regulation response regulator NtrX